MQEFWIENRQPLSVITKDKEKGILVSLLWGGTRWISWDEAKQLHEENPENGLLSIVLTRS